jgi:hypothetical protein
VIQAQSAEAPALVESKSNIVIKPKGSSQSTGLR